MLMQYEFTFETWYWGQKTVDISDTYDCMFIGCHEIPKSPTAINGKPTVTDRALIITNLQFETDIV